MAVTIALTHRTRYAYDREIALSPQVVRLRPAPHCRTPIRSYSFQAEPREHFIHWQQDPFGNFLARLVFPKKTRSLSISVDLIAELITQNPFDFFLDKEAQEYPFIYAPGLGKELLPYLEPPLRGPLLSAYLKEVDVRPRRTIDMLVDLNRKVSADIRYIIRMESGVQTPEETLRLASGSCRDSAWLLVQIARHLGFAARFVSGYVLQLKPDLKPVEGPAGPERDFADLHAWVEVFLPGAGWVGFDPTSGLLAGEGHLPLACSPSPGGAAPISGATDKCEVEFSFDMQLTRWSETPRPTRPYSDEVWAHIAATGEQVDANLQSNGIALTCGGEPTFISASDPDAPEWNCDAFGPTKKTLAEDLILRLRDKLSFGALLHHGQGKWYPGESLPRWNIACYWRTDGHPVWHNPRLLARECQGGVAHADEAQALARALLRVLGLGAECLHPAYEDAYHQLWQEGRLPDDVDLHARDLSDSEERRRLLRLLERGLGQVAGYAIPLCFDESARNFRSQRWTFRRGRLLLVPGDSPLGYRLPLDSLGLGLGLGLSVPCAYAPKPPLPEPRQLPPNAPAPSHGAASALLAPGALRSALCVEPRSGHLCVFLPPLPSLESFLGLVAVVEQAASSLDLPVIVEGYAPPADERLRCLKVSPDPGVIEVNIPPSSSFSEQAFLTAILYEEARQSKLSAEKFLLDGRHVGTGGGNHITLGGALPSRSPFFTRPDLLASLLNFVQHHPSLSYLFSGLFIGPTSQAPRADEARMDNLPELEVALSQIADASHPAPWKVDRLLRHFLVDVTGNTHRAEISIDKLYAPESLQGRLGLVEMRAFEMQPHPRLSLAQVLMLRALVAGFAQSPYRHPLVPWGTDLHDRFMLPHYIWRDFQEVLGYLRACGFHFAEEWYAPFAEFRFPHYGTVEHAGIEVELRMALEPWIVLGEEMTAQGTARFVDSSMERLQVRVRGLTPTRYFLACNGRRVPLQPTGTNGEYVAGVRFKAWRCPSALHPAMEVHAPLIFDLFDLWNHRSVGGCTYHVADPGGQNHEHRPLNALEAEARRVSRFWSHGHTQGFAEPPEEHPHPAFPCTLDLRRPPHTLSR